MASRGSTNKNKLTMTDSLEHQNNSKAATKPNLNSIHFQRLLQVPSLFYRVFITKIFQTHLRPRVTRISQTLLLVIWSQFWTFFRHNLSLNISYNMNNWHKSTSQIRNHLLKYNLYYKVWITVILNNRSTNINNWFKC